LIALGRSDRLNSETQRLAEEFGQSRVAGYQVDMYDLDKLTQILDEIVSAEGRIDGLVNNAHELGFKSGFNTSLGSLENSSFDQWNRHFLSGLYWPSLTIQKLGPQMKDAGRGSIVNISTMYALVAPSPALYEGTGLLNPPGYSATKAGLLSFTRYVASFWGIHGIRANAILPGPFSNVEDQGENTVSKEDPFIDRLKARTCLGRIGHPSELVGAMIYLISDASTYMTGQGLVIDGGWTVT
jgi:gluconate 5-dehydrogenase